MNDEQQNQLINKNPNPNKLQFKANNNKIIQQRQVLFQSGQGKQKLSFQRQKIRRQWIYNQKQRIRTIQKARYWNKQLKILDNQKRKKNKVQYTQLIEIKMKKPQLNFDKYIDLYYFPRSKKQNMLSHQYQIVQNPTKKIVQYKDYSLQYNPPQKIVEQDKKRYHRNIQYQYIPQQKIIQEDKKKLTENIRYQYIPQQKIIQEDKKRFIKNIQYQYIPRQNIIQEDKKQLIKNIQYQYIPRQKIAFQDKKNIHHSFFYRYIPQYANEIDITKIQDRNDLYQIGKQIFDINFKDNLYFIGIVRKNNRGRFHFTKKMIKINKTSILKIQKYFNELKRMKQGVFMIPEKDLIIQKDIYKNKVYYSLRMIIWYTKQWYHTKNGFNLMQWQMSQLIKIIKNHINYH